MINPFIHVLYRLTFMTYLTYLNPELLCRYCVTELKVDHQERYIKLKKYQVIMTQKKLASSKFPSIK